MFEINYRDSRPIYEQIKDGLRKLLVTGGIKADEKLPSVREMASNMSINPNTIQRAYRELESEGYIYSVPGKGSFAAGVDETHEKMREELKAKFIAVTVELKTVNVEKDTVKGWVDEIYDQ
ncbi:MAG: GntR family transcriptional regulator [Lachnospiraceae bacterium]|nr:GntR family transcriptional regulator [Lachnospiraceae bacterium]